MIIIGSTALKYFNLNRDKPKDFDIFMYEGEILPDNIKFDKIVIPKKLYDLIPVENGIATPDFIYTLKCSHFMFDIHWEKTKLDILWLKDKGCILDVPIFNEFKKYWLIVHGEKSRLSLNKSKNDFFNDNVTYVYEHDYLHQLIVYPKDPTYKKCLKDNAEVMIDKYKFDNLSFDDKISLFKEEIAVIALERWIINPRTLKKFTKMQAFNFSLKKVIVDLTKNWASDFIIFNIEKFATIDYSLLNPEIEEIIQINNSNIIAIEEFKKISVEIHNDLGLGFDENDYYQLNNFLYSLSAHKFKHNNNSNNILFEIIKFASEHNYNYCIFKIKDKIFKSEWLSNLSDDDRCSCNILSSLVLVKPIEKTITDYILI